MDDEQISKAAPDGATHYVIMQYDFTEGFIRLKDGAVYSWDGKGWLHVPNFDLNGYYDIRSLSDIRKIAA